jgi:hypothetical protein
VAGGRWQRDRIIERTFPTPVNGANLLCRIRSGSLPATAALRCFQGRYSAGRARQRRRRCKRARLPMADRDGFHTPSGSPRTESISWFADRASGRFFPAEIRSDIGAFPSASLAGEPRLYIGKPDVIRPSVAADCRPMAAPIIRATGGRERPAARISPKVIFFGRIAHDCAARAGSEAAGCWAFAAWAYYGRAVRPWMRSSRA